MNQYWVKGQIIPRQSSVISNSDGNGHQNALEPFAKAYWADSPDEALEAAQAELNGGTWVEPPVVTETSEEMRMRALGAPELPLDFG